MKNVVMMHVAPDIRKELTPFYREISMTNDSMDDGTIRAILKEDKIKCRLLSPIFWKWCKNLEILNLVIIETTEGLFWSGKIKHDPVNKKVFLQKFNSIWQDMEFDLSIIKAIYIVEYYVRDCTLN
jgi:hypothetical protein